jgi:hypothetical protein
MKSLLEVVLFAALMAALPVFMLLNSGKFALATKGIVKMLVGE